MFFAYSLLLVVLSTTLTDGVKQKIQSEIGKDFKLKCPEKQGVYGVEVEFQDEFLAKPKPFHEWQWTIYCRPFIEVGKEDKGDEDCEEKSAVPIAYNELVFEDSGMNCDCNQYLAGITGKIDTEKYHGEADQQRRMISLRCCRKKNNFIEIRTCEMVGPKTLYFPEGPVKFNALKDWDVPDNFQFPKFFVTGVSIYENMMMVQQCRFAVLKHHKKAKELKKKIKDAKCDFFYLRDFMNDYTKIKKCEDIPIGWPRPMVLSNQDPSTYGLIQSWGYKYFNQTNPLAPDYLLFSDQFTVCADGQIIYSVSKYVRFDQKAQKKDYIFLTKCAEFERQPCMCKWNTTCDEKNWNKTCTDDDGDDTAKCQKYWSGFKSQYVTKTNKRKFEIFCCTSSSINFVDCNWTRWQNDTDVKMILPKPRIKSYSEGGVGDVVGFRDFRVKWEGKNMLVQYNVCNTNDSGSPGCHYPCFPKLDQPKEKSKSDANPRDPNSAGISGLVGIAGLVPTDKTTVKSQTVATVRQTTANKNQSSLATQKTTVPTVRQTTPTALTTLTIPTTTRHTTTNRQTTTTKPTTTNQITTTKQTTTTKTSTTAPTTTTTKGCGNTGINLVIMLDSSGSLGQKGFNLEKNFITSFLSSFNFDTTDLGHSASSLTLLEFGVEVVQQIGFTDYTTAAANAQIIAKVNSLPYFDSMTNILGSMQEAIPIFNGISASDTRPKVAILLTDGYNNIPDSSDATQAQLIATSIALQDAIGVQNLYGVGATSDAATQVPLLVDPSNFLYAPRYADLAGLVSRLKQSICANYATTTPAPTTSSATTGCAPIIAGNYPAAITYSNPPLASGYYPDKTIAYLTCQPGQHFKVAGNGNHLVTYHSICANGQFRAFAIGTDACVSD